MTTTSSQRLGPHPANSGTFKHSGGPYGENLYMAEGMEVTGATAVEDWYAEIKDYNFTEPGFSDKTGHFTQVVWKGSKQIGVGIVCTGSTAYVVANYDPPGNYESKFPQNVLSPH
ncbi:CAP family protein [Nocardia sp. NPDC049707]|uniref:CAP family protein n=1 Tax=Nocardia sp. NPDC049707 TaxID=3154735 RepID=UPI0034326C8C